MGYYTKFIDFKPQWMIILRGNMTFKSNMWCTHVTYIMFLELMHCGYNECRGLILCECILLFTLCTYTITLELILSPKFWRPLAFNLVDFFSWNENLQKNKLDSKDETHPHTLGPIWLLFAFTWCQTSTMSATPKNQCTWNFIRQANVVDYSDKDH